MSAEKNILLLDSETRRSQALADRLYRMGFVVRRAKTAEDAFQLAAERGLQFGAALVPPDLPVANLAGALTACGRRLDDGSLVWLVVGRSPEPERMQALRDAGVRLALWEPFDDGALRFQVNRALAGLCEIAPRRELRVPVGLATEIRAGARRKVAGVYTLSAAGAFLETPRPSLKGAPVSLDLPIGAGITAEGRVVYTNVPGNLRKRTLPVGMAIAFTGLPDEAEQVIRRRVAEKALSLVL